jgi:hypothetical protein
MPLTVGSPLFNLRFWFDTHIMMSGRVTHYRDTMSLFHQTFAIITAIRQPMMKMRMLWLHQLASCLILLLVQVEESHAFSVGREYRFVHARATPKTIVVPISPSPPSSPRATAVTMILSSTPKDDNDNNNNNNDNN